MSVSVVLFLPDPASGLSEHGTGPAFQTPNPKPLIPLSLSARGTASAAAGDVLYAAHAGDSRAVLCRGGSALRLTEDHKPNLPAERERVESAGALCSAALCAAALHSELLSWFLVGARALQRPCRPPVSAPARLDRVSCPIREPDSKVSAPPHRLAGGRVDFARCWRVIVDPGGGRPASGLAVSR